MRKSSGLHARKSWGNSWVIVESDDIGNDTNVVTVSSKPQISNSGSVAIINYENGRKEMYDYSRGYKTGNLRSI